MVVDCYWVLDCGGGCVDVVVFNVVGVSCKVWVSFFVVWGFIDGFVKGDECGFLGKNWDFCFFFGFFD